MAPVPLVLVAAALAAAGTAASAYSAYQSGQSQKAAADYNAEVDEQRARTARLQAGSAEDQQRAQARELLARQRGQVAETGFEALGTNATLLGQSAHELEMDALTTRYQGDMEAAGLVADSRLQTMQGRAAASAGRTQGVAGALSAAGGLVASVGTYRAGAAAATAARTDRALAAGRSVTYRPIIRTGTGLAAGV